MNYECELMDGVKI